MIRNLWTTSTSNLWHLGLGKSSPKIIKSLNYTNQVNVFSWIKSRVICSSCRFGKSHRLSLQVLTFGNLSPPHNINMIGSNLVLFVVHVRKPRPRGPKPQHVGSTSVRLGTVHNVATMSYGAVTLRTHKKVTAADELSRRQRYIRVPRHQPRCHGSTTPTLPNISFFESRFIKTLYQAQKSL